MPHNNKKRRSSIAVALSALFLSATVLAEVLEEIVVIATMRAENIQDIPISISAITGEQIQQNVIRSLEELAIQIPNLSVSNGMINDNIHIRGVGSGIERSFEQAVGVFIDSTYMPRSRQYRAPFFDVERVEVARGPQSVLFGLNATAGAISVHSARSRPGDDLIADITVEYEAAYRGKALTTVFGGSPIDTLGLRLAARVLDSGDGYWNNLTTGKDENSLEDTLVRGSIVYAPSDKLTLDAKVEYSDFSRDGNLDELHTDAGAISDGDDELNWVRGQDGSLLQLYPSPVRPGFEGELLNIAASIEHKFQNGGALDGILGHSDYDWTMYFDLDGTPVPIIDSGIIETYKQSSIELRYASNDDRALQYLFGGYYQSSQLTNDHPNLVDGAGIGLGPLGFPVAGFDAGRLWSKATFLQDEDVISLYGTLNWDVSDRVQIRGGVRFVESEKDHSRGGECLVRRSDGTYDDLDLVDNSNDFLLSLIGFCPTPVDPPRQQRSSDNVLPELSVQWSVNDSTMLYARLGKSAKSGGFIASTVVTPGFFEYDDETGVGSEIGLKASLAEGRGELNVAIFHTDYDDMQLNTFDPDTAASVVRNAGEIRSRGIELEGRWAVSDTVTLGGAIGFLNAEFTQFPVGPCYPGEPMNPGDLGCDKTGKTLPYSPDYSGNVYVDVDAPVNNRLMFHGGFNVAFSDSYLTSATLDPLGEQDAYTKIDVRVGIGAGGGKWRLSVIGKNLTDERVNNFTEAFLGVYRGYIQEPRTVWLQGRYNLGK